MENLKPLAEVLQPDERNLRFVNMDTLETCTIEENYAELISVALNPNVPEKVRSYFATFQNICLYAWFSYDLYAVSEFLCFTAMEMALRVRFSAPGKGAPKLKKLMERAVKEKLVEDKNFTHIRDLRRRQAQTLRRTRRLMKISRKDLPRSNFAEMLVRDIPAMRNAFAHPRIHTVLMPSDALFRIRMAAEFINQLFRRGRVS